MNPFPTDEEVGNCGLHRRTPYMMHGVSLGMLSVARFSGTCKYNGEYYTYFPEPDALVRDDVIKHIVKSRKKS